MSIIFSAFVSFLITFIAIPTIINIAKLKHLFDEPSARKLHHTKIPNLGGIAIVFGIIFSSFFFVDFSNYKGFNYILCALILIFFVGVKDDLLVSSYRFKFIAQLLAGVVIVYFGGIKISSFYELFGLNEIHYNIFGVIDVYDIIVFSVSVFFIVLVINAYNLIDGVDWLAACMGIITTLSFGIWFLVNNENMLAILSFATIGSLIAFMYYNYSPAKIFMGDTGSLSVGLISAILAIEFIELNGRNIGDYNLKAVPAVAFAVMIIPLFDTLRVFTIRILRKKSPFYADKNHAHHKLVQLKLTHIQTSMVMSVVNILFIVAAFFMQMNDINVNIILFSFIIVISILSQLPYYLIKRQKSKARQAFNDNRENLN